MRSIVGIGCACLTMLACAEILHAHELRPAYLELRQRDSEDFDVLWKVPARGDLKLALYVRFPDDCELVKNEVVYQMDDAHIERWRLNCPDGLVGRQITVDGLSTSLTDVLVRMQWLDGRSQTVRLDAAQVSFTVEAAPTLMQLAAAYVVMGMEHILLGIDHLLFVLGLLMIVRNTSTLIKTITAFTVAHSITLALAVLGFVNVPTRPVDAAIALSIVFLGAEIIHTQRGQQSLTVRLPWIVAFAFGLLHGLGFAGALTGLGLPPSDIPAALLFFNVGVEVGQLLFVVFFLVMAWAFRTLQFHRPEWCDPIPGYAIGTVASYWLIGRLAVLVGA